jgi:hypothetical protein
LAKIHGSDGFIAKHFGDFPVISYRLHGVQGNGFAFNIRRVAYPGYGFRWVLRTRLVKRVLVSECQYSRENLGRLIIVRSNIV